MTVILDGLFLENTTYDYKDDYDYKEESAPGASEAVLVPLLCSLVLAVGLPGNGLVLAALVQKRRTWSISDILVLHLSAVDALLLATLPVWAAQAAQGCDWCLRIPLCQVSAVLFKMNFYCGIFLLAFLSLDRYLSVAHAARLYSREKPRLAFASFLSVWLASLLLTVPDWRPVAVRRDADAGCIPSYYLPNGNLVPRLLHHVLGFLLPALASLAACVGLLRHLRRGGLRKHKADVLILALAGVFFACWLPYNAALIADTYRRSQATGSHLRTALMATAALACVHACLRPPLYLGLCGDFRKRAAAWLRCGGGGEREDPRGSLWELGVGEDVICAQEQSELKQMNTNVEQVQASPC